MTFQRGNLLPTRQENSAHKSSELINRKNAAVASVEKLVVRKEFLEAKLEELYQTVGKAKGRALLKPDVDEFIEHLQSLILRKAVGSYETLLTALVNDVLGTEDRVGLDLYMERGLPALDIFIDAEGGREDIMNGTGGSMTNIISLGLRMIATVRSNMRKFVALDEPDCWIAPSKVSNFYRVIDDLGSKLDVQSLIISHHDVSLVPDGCSIVKMYKSDGEIVCENDPNRKTWRADQEGIRRIQITNFMSHVDTTINLGPGATMIVGDNHIGKSVCVRALRAVAYAEVSSADIRHGEKELSVELEIEGDRVVKLTRNLKRNPVNEWTLEDKCGNILVDTDTNTEYKTGGRSAPPEWVSKILGIDKFEGLEHQLSHQKMPVFLLGEVASKRASVLSIGKESGYVQKMLACHKGKSKEDQVCIKNGEIEVAVILEETKALSVLDDMLERTEELSAALININKTQENISKVADNLYNIERNQRNIDLASRKTCVLNKLPSSIDQKIFENLKKLEEISDVGSRISNLSKTIQKSKEISSIFKFGIPSTPNVKDTSTLEADISGLVSLESKIVNNKNLLKNSSEELTKSKKELDSMYEALGRVCPLCNSNIPHNHKAG